MYFIILSLIKSSSYIFLSNSLFKVLKYIFIHLFIKIIHHYHHHYIEHYLYYDFKHLNHLFIILLINLGSLYSIKYNISRFNASSRSLIITLPFNGTTHHYETIFIYLTDFKTLILNVVTLY